MESTNPGYDPFTYQPILRHFYTGNALLPEEIELAIAANPGRAEHIKSVWLMAQWMKANLPDFYAVVAERRPDLLDPSQSVVRGELDVRTPGFAGFGQAIQQDSIMTQWGTALMDLAKGWLSYDTQRTLMKTNISRAERGLPPIDPGSVAPQVQVGVSPQVMNLLIGGMVLLGLFAAASTVIRARR